MDPESGQQLSLCPWLRKTPNKNSYTCDIYNDRPEDCRYYPVSIADMVDDACEMLEPRDLENRKYAQKVLDKLMINSR